MIPEALTTALACLVSCASLGPAGDEQALAWDKPAPECKERPVVDCRDGEIRITEDCSVLRDCEMVGSVRIMGEFRNANDSRLIDPSHSVGYVGFLREQAPAGVLLENVRITGIGTVPLYLGPGTTYATLIDVTIVGESKGPGVYFGAESSRNVASNLRVNVRTKREQIAVDASDHNTIEAGTKDIKLYRNCGEAGVTRHTTPSFNFIASTGRIVENSRRGLRLYCHKDAGFPWGSSQSDGDHGRGNTLREHK